MSEDAGRYAWSPAQLRQAIWLGYGGRSATALPTRAFAGEVGVSQRTVQRWLAGTSRPNPAHAARLRGLLTPPADVLARQAKDRSHLQAQLIAIRSPRGRAISAQVRAMGWHEPHRLIHLTHTGYGLNRLMVVILHSVKPAPIPPGWAVTAAITYENRPLALIAKHQILEQVAPWRIAVRADLLAKGRHEAWLDTAPPIDITTLPH
ncbi:hypothetical protein [Intrasporangium sp.]|uniref:helix-turn-helix domain-containing protein n=1 Tax=Intrasporangium sp. TaxID=1925024 RepID=UPI003222188F